MLLHGICSHKMTRLIMVLDKQTITWYFSSGNTLFAEGLQCSPHGQLQISPGLPANHNLPPDMADYRLASLSKNRYCLFISCANY